MLEKNYQALNKLVTSIEDDGTLIPLEMEKNIVLIIAKDMQWDKKLVEFILSHLVVIFSICEKFWENPDDQDICELVLQLMTMRAVWEFFDRERTWYALLNPLARIPLELQLCTSLGNLNKKIYENMQKQLLQMKTTISNSTKVEKHQCKSLSECIKLFETEEWSDAKTIIFECPNCKNTPSVWIRKEILHPPQVLVIPLKRTRTDLTTKREHKINHLLECPLQLTIDKNIKYSMTSMIEHSGVANSGHYTATVLNPRDKNWYKISDTSVSPTKKKKGKKCFSSEDVITLLYERLV